MSPTLCFVMTDLHGYTFVSPVCVTEDNLADKATLPRCPQLMAPSAVEHTSMIMLESWAIVAGAIPRKLLLEDSAERVQRGYWQQASSSGPESSEHEGAGGDSTSDSNDSSGVSDSAADDTGSVAATDDAGYAAAAAMLASLGAVSLQLPNDHDAAVLVAAALQAVDAVEEAISTAKHRPGYVAAVRATMAADLPMDMQCLQPFQDQLARRFCPGIMAGRSRASRAVVYVTNKKLLRQKSTTTRMVGTVGCYPLCSSASSAS